MILTRNNRNINCISVSKLREYLNFKLNSLKCLLWYLKEFRNLWVWKISFIIVMRNIKCNYLRQDTCIFVMKYLHRRNKGGVSHFPSWFRNLTKLSFFSDDYGEKVIFILHKWHKVVKTNRKMNYKKDLVTSWINKVEFIEKSKCDN